MNDSISSILMQDHEVTKTHWNLVGFREEEELANKLLELILAWLLACSRAG